MYDCRAEALLILGRRIAALNLRPVEVLSYLVDQQPVKIVSNMEKNKIMNRMGLFSILLFLGSCFLTQLENISHN